MTGSVVVFVDVQLCCLGKLQYTELALMMREVNDEISRHDFVVTMPLL